MSVIGQEIYKLSINNNIFDILQKEMCVLQGLTWKKCEFWHISLTKIKLHLAVFEFKNEKIIFSFIKVNNMFEKCSQLFKYTTQNELQSFLIFFLKEIKK